MVPIYSNGEAAKISALDGIRKGGWREMSVGSVKNHAGVLSLNRREPLFLRAFSVSGLMFGRDGWG